MEKNVLPDGDDAGGSKIRSTCWVPILVTISPPLSFASGAAKTVTVSMFFADCYVSSGTEVTGTCWPFFTFSRTSLICCCNWSCLMQAVSGAQVASVNGLKLLVGSKNPLLLCLATEYCTYIYPVKVPEHCHQCYPPCLICLHNKQASNNVN